MRKPSGKWCLEGYAGSESKPVSLPESLASIWTKIPVLAGELIVAIAASYVVFLQMDVR